MSQSLFQRRELLKLIGSAPFLALFSSCAAAPRPPVWTGAPRGELIDVHCHLFNASDLPAVRFFKIVLLELYPRQAISVLDVHDPDIVDGMLALLTWVLGRTKAPTAKREIAALKTSISMKQASKIALEQGAAVQSAVAEFIAAQTGPIAASSAPPTRGELLIANALAAAADGEGPMSAAAPRSPRRSATDTARKAYESKTDIGTYLRWFGLVTHYRYALADQLAEDHSRQGFKAKLLVPALVDYDMWLGEDVDASPLPQQVEVLSMIAQRDDGPSVHGYVAFDPLRQAYHDANIEGSVFEPLALVKSAIRDSGFLGVKLYPPMGFKPFGNEGTPQKYPEKVTHNLNGQVGQALDNALGSLYKLCTAMDAPIIAHANRSNGAGPDYADRADPAFWLPVFDRWPSLRVCLAHFGSFSFPSVNASGMTMPEASWEWTLGRYLADNPAREIYADISYLSEIFGKPESVQKTAANVRSFVNLFDKDVTHLMFGTDWIMLGLESSYPVYTGQVYEFFSKDCGFTSEQMDRLFHGNAERFLGLTRGTQTWSRLTSFYMRNGLDMNRLKALLRTSGRVRGLR